MQKYMHLLWIVAIFLSGHSSAAIADCYVLEGGEREITIGWFNRRTYNADTVCITGDYAKKGFSAGLQFILKNEGKKVVTYPASSERYTNTDVRFTLSDGEPEPTQFNAKITGRVLTSIQLGSWVRVELE